ncbi:MAG: InlB B-repeat-containing protein, partial [Phycisphaerae bacterium]
MSVLPAVLAFGVPNWGEVDIQEYSANIHCQIYEGSEQLATTEGSILTVWTPQGALAAKLLATDGYDVGGGVPRLFTGLMFCEQTSMSDLSMKLYDAGTGIYYDLNNTITFNDGVDWGNMFFPYEFTGGVTEMATHTVTFDAGEHGTVTSGDAVQQVYDDQDAAAPTITENTGAHFSGWDADFTHVTEDITIHAEYVLDTFTVTFVAGTEGAIAAGEAVQEVEYGSAAVAPTITPNEGVEFTGWDGDFSSVTSKLTITATYTGIAHTVTFDAGAHGSLSGETVQSVEYGDSAIAPELVPETGWHFTSWDVDFSYVTVDLTVTAQYEINTSEVTFDAGENASITSGNAVQTIDYGSAATAPEIDIETGWYFTGWDSDFSEITSDLTVTAQYIALSTAAPNWPASVVDVNQMTVVCRVFDGSTQLGNATGSIIAVFSPEGTLAGKLELSDDQGLFSGVVFYSSSFASDFTLRLYDAGSLIYHDITEQVTFTAGSPLGYFYAPYDFTGTTEAPSHTVTFDAGSLGEFTAGETPLMVFEGQDASAPEVAPDAGYRFTGWDASIEHITSDAAFTAQYVLVHTVTFSAGEHGSIAEGDAVQTIDDGRAAVAPMIDADSGWRFTGWDASFVNVTGDITVTAQYGALYTVTFNAGEHGEITAGDAEQSVDYGTDAIAPAITPDTGWEFAGWNSSFTHVTSDITITALYERITFTVTFDAGEHGSIVAGVAEQIVNYGASAAAPTINPEAGYAFGGWDTVFANVLDDLTVTAQYNPIIYTVTFMAGAHGEITAGETEQQVGYGRAATAPTVTPESGYMFSGWDVDFSSVTSNLTVTAQYATGFTVTFDAGAHGTITSGSSVQGVVAGGSAIAPEITAIGEYEFYGWDSDFTDVSENITVTALYSVLNAAAPSWTAPTSQAFSMTLVCQVFADGVQLGTGSGSVLSAWRPNGDISGVGDEVIQGPSGKVFMSTLFNEIGYEEDMTFVLYDGDTGKYYGVGGTITFSDSDTIGNIFGPYVFSSASELSTFNVRFIGGEKGAITGGEPIQRVYAGLDAAEPTVTPEAGWIFDGWDGSFEAVSEDRVLTAQYAQHITHQVTFVAGENGSITAGAAVQTV